MAESKALVNKNVGEQVIARINSLCESGFTMPKDFSYVNAIKMSMLKLQDVKDRNGKPALEVCTPSSVQQALFKMVTRGLNASLNQCYFIVRGDQLCCDDSYFGKILMVKRIHPDYEAVPVVIREGDTFEYGIDAKTGKRFVIKHEQKLENIDKGFVGAYIYLPNGELYLMTKKQILAAWSKSANKSLSTHKEFDEKMIGKTVINSGLNKIINSTPEYNLEDSDDGNSDEPSNAKLQEHTDYTEYEEVDDNTDQPAPINVDKETGEVKEQAGKQPDASDDMDF